MSLVHTELSSVEVSRQAGFKISTVNTIVKNLIENDQTFFGLNASPGVWERRWYNDTGNKSLYYKKGDAVWINTEPALEFVDAHATDINMYVQGCADARYKLISLSAAGDVAGISKLYRDIALGQGEFDRGIYYLGNLLDPVQIRVSLSDDNNREPTDNEYWTDFFDKSKDEAFYHNQILSAVEKQLSQAYDRHLMEYHLSGLQDIDEFYCKYLQADLTNIGSLQKFVNHSWYQPDMTGFDHVVLFGKRNAADGQCQWFRIWKSGFLEHGGIVKVADAAHDCGTNNEDAKLYTVNLGWNYSGKTAPTYDFPSAGINGFYSHDSQIYTGFDTVNYNQKHDAVGSAKRYVVDINPIMTLDWEVQSSGPYALQKTDRFSRYPGKEVTDMNNGSFTFLYSSGFKMYSYYVKGFTVNKVRYY